jgi:biotin operon repressor
VIFLLTIDFVVRVRTGSPNCLVDRTFTIEISLDNTKKPKKKRILPIYRNPVYLAKEYAWMIETGDAKSESDLARKMGISRVRVNQFIKLLKLDASIIQSIEKLGDPLTSRMITERMLRPYIRNLENKDSLEPLAK